MLFFFEPAYSQPKEGNDYVLVNIVQNGPPAPANEVIEFFSYSCPHCYSFEAPLKKWLDTDGKKFHLIKVHIKRTDNNDLHQRLFFSLERLGVSEDIHMKVFAEIHRKHNNLKTVDSIIVFAATLGIDKLTFLVSFDSPEVTERIKAAQKLIDAYQIRSTPSLVINGKYKTGLAYFGKKKSLTNQVLSIFQSPNNTVKTDAQQATIDALTYLSKQ